MIAAPSSALTSRSLIDDSRGVYVAPIGAFRTDQVT
jgi:hypothetical protein